LWGGEEINKREEWKVTLVDSIAKPWGALPNNKPRCELLGAEKKVQKEQEKIARGRRPAKEQPSRLGKTRPTTF